jgi:hypothetical protein
LIGGNRKPFSKEGKHVMASTSPNDYTCAPVAETGAISLVRRMLLANIRIFQPSGVLLNPLTATKAGKYRKCASLCGLLLLLFLGIGQSYGHTTIPDTPAGHASRAWIEAFNSGDRAKIQAYI